MLDSPWTYKAMVASIFQWWSGSWWMERKLSIVKAIVPWRTSPVHQQNTTRFQKPIFVQMQVTVTMYYLSEEGRLIKTANAFGIAKNAKSMII